MEAALTKRQIQTLKGRAQRLEPVLRVGKHGLSSAFLQSVDDALSHHELIKVRFDDFKTERKELAAQMAARTGSQLITIVGHVAVLFRKKSNPASADEQPETD